MAKLLTEFGEKLNKDLPLNDYPRPQMQRDSFQNLNGIWEYAILPKSEKLSAYQGAIVVPFSPECILSGVERILQPNEVLYYRRTFNFQKENARTLLHFGAVDYICEVTVNGQLVGKNVGGYYPFTFEITSVVQEGENEITVKVTDPSETGAQAKGKQTRRRGGIWYTPQSGIWQTVWIEQVPVNYITAIKLTPDIDKDGVDVEITYSKTVEKARLTVFDRGERKVSLFSRENGTARVLLKNYELWSPENPRLYDLEITAGEDTVRTYFGMRKFGIGKDYNGYPRLFLNNEPYFHNGLLDQGYWSDGMYTPASDEAMIYDITTMKKLGFNMLRKHIKIEPLRWYYHCDRIGMLVWQDMINGGDIYKFGTIAIKPFLGKRMDDRREGYKDFSRADGRGRAEYYSDAERMVDALYNVVSLSVWVPFNEGWGQFDSLKAYRFFKEKDPTRIIDHASGWHDQGGGDLKSMHIYFTPIKIPKDERPVVLSEFGGFSLRSSGHMFNEKKFFGYRKYKSQEAFERAYRKLFERRIIANIPHGLAAAVYTELSDVEDECNGLLSYDRRVLKINPELTRELNEQIRID